MLYNYFNGHGMWSSENEEELKKFVDETIKMHISQYPRSFKDLQAKEKRDKWIENGSKKHRQTIKIKR
jgi:hypothetical protein